jgi:hypothetical protein
LLGVNTATLLSGGHFNAVGSIVSPSYRPTGSANISFQNNLGIEFARISQSGAFVGSDQITINNGTGFCSFTLNCTAAGGKNWKIISTADNNLGGASNLQIYNQTNTTESIRINGNDNSTRIFGSLSVDGGISSSSSDINFNNKNITNINNVCRQLWVLAAAPTFTTNATLGSLPTALKPALTLNTNTSFVYRYVIPYTFHGERLMIFRYFRQIFGCSNCGLQLTLAIYTSSTGLLVSSVLSSVYNTTAELADMISMNLSGLGLIYGVN